MADLARASHRPGHSSPLLKLARMATVSRHSSRGRALISPATPPEPHTSSPRSMPLWKLRLGPWLWSVRCALVGPDDCVSKRGVWARLAQAPLRNIYLHPVKGRHHILAGELKELGHMLASN